VGGRSEQAVEIGERRSVVLGQDLARRRREAGIDGREERVRRFLIVRDPVDAGRRFRQALDAQAPEGKLLLPPPPPPVRRHGKEGGGE